MRLSGQTHVTVGGSTGWGRAVSQQLAAEGANVVIVDAPGGDLEQVERDIAAAGGKVRTFAADISNLADLLRVAAQLDGGISGLATNTWHSNGPRSRIATWTGSNRWSSTISSVRLGR